MVISHSLLIIAGAVCFVLKAFEVPVKVDLFALGWAFVVSAFL